MQQNDLSDFISQIASKYEQPTFNTSNENHIISQAENLLLQFGIQSKSTQKKKKQQKTKIDSTPKFVKKQFKPIQNQISTLIIAPKQNSPIMKNEDDNLFSSSSSNCKINDISSDTFDQLVNDEIININTDEKRTKIDKDKNQKRKKLNEIDINSLNNLLDEIEAEFSVSEKQKNETKKPKKENVKKSNKKETSFTKSESTNDKKETTNNNNNSSTKRKKSNKKESITESNSKSKPEEEDKDFSKEIDQINKFYLNKFFSKMKSKFTLRNKNYNVIKLVRKYRLKIYFHRWIEAKKNQQNLPRFQEFDHLKRIEELGDEYQKQIFARKFLLLWARYYRFRVQKRVEKEIENQNMNPHLKINLKKQKLVKKPPPPQIQVDPKIEEMIKQNNEIKNQKLNNIKIQIKQDKMKQQQIQKEIIENEKKKRMMHLKNLQKQKIERQNKMKNEEEKIRNQRIFSSLCNKAENHYETNLKRRVLNNWKSILISNDENDIRSRNQFKKVIKKIFFVRMKEKFLKKENQKMISAIKFNNNLLMKRSLLAIKKVKEERKKKMPIVQKNSELHLMHHFFDEWKSNKIASRRNKKLKAIEFYESHLIRRAFNVFVSSIKQNKEEEKRKNFKEKLIQKAHQYLNENQQKDDEEPLRLTLNSGTLNSNQTSSDNNNDYEPIKPLKDTLQISLDLLDSNDNLKFDNDSDDFF